MPMPFDVDDAIVDVVEVLVVSREGGRKEEAGFERIVEHDFVRECVRAGIVEVEVVEEEERVLDVEAFRRCLYCVKGGRERSCFTGSVLVLDWVCEEALPRREDVDLCNVFVVEEFDASLGLRVDVERCSPAAPAVSFTDGFERGREEGGRMLLSLVILPFELGGRVLLVVVVERVGGRIGRRLGDVLPRVGIEDCLLRSVGS